MADYKYAFNEFEADKMAKCVGRDVSISSKHAIEICKFIRGKNLQKAKDLLTKIANKELALKFTRFNRGLGHKPGKGPGRYPVSASTEIKKLLESVENNAVFKGLDANNLIIKHICCHRASRPLKMGRRTRGESKRSHVEIVVEEKIYTEKNKGKEKSQKKTESKNNQKKETKPVKEAKK